MEILEYFALPEAEQAYWAEQVGKGDWRAAVYLHGLLKNGAARDRYGPEMKLFLLTEGKSLLAFCTYGMRDEIDDDTLYPWVGFVYTFPEHRGKRYSQKLIDRACRVAKDEGHPRMYLTSNEIGLYEKYGFRFLEERQTIWQETTRLFCREV